VLSLEINDSNVFKKNNFQDSTREAKSSEIDERTIRHSQI